MDVALYRSRAPRLRFWPGTRNLVGVRPLSRTAIDNACDSVAEHWRAYELPSGNMLNLAETAAILAASLCSPTAPYQPVGDANAIANATTTDTLSSLGLLWFKVQEGATPEQQSLLAELELRLAESDALTMTNAINASQCDNAGQFYGEPLHLLTDGQLIYYYSLQIIQNRTNNTGDRTRCVNLSLLRKRAGRSEPTNQTDDTSPKYAGRAQKRWSA